MQQKTHTTLTNQWTDLIAHSLKCCFINLVLPESKYVIKII